VRQLEEEQEQLARDKEEQLVGQLMSSCQGSEEERREVRRLVQREITACLHPEVRRVGERAKGWWCIRYR
jgi:hypothetical protein